MQYEDLIFSIHFNVIVLKTSKDVNGDFADVAMSLCHLSPSMSITYLAAFVFLVIFTNDMWIPAMKPQSRFRNRWVSSASLIGGIRQVFLQEASHFFPKNQLPGDVPLTNL